MRWKEASSDLDAPDEDLDDRDKLIPIDTFYSIVDKLETGLKRRRRDRGVRTNKKSSNVLF